MLVQWKIRLLLNPNEARSAELYDTIDAAFKRLQEEVWNEAEMIAAIETITRLAQQILKGEWQRVKEGS